jgi:hypothetical protein
MVLMSPKEMEQAAKKQGGRTERAAVAMMAGSGVRA